MSAAVIKRGAPRTAKPVIKPVVMIRVPVAPRRFYARLAIGVAGLLVLAGAVAAIVAGVPGQMWQATARATARAGFEVRHVEVHGVATGPRLAVIAAALEGPTNSMLLVDLTAARARLRALPWVADASVSRRLPDRLIVDVIERRAVALWQFQHRLAAIDRAGVPLTADRLERFAALPLVVGPDANRHVDELLTLLAAAPRLAATVDAATFVGTRRWDLRFTSGETLALPEGGAARRALTRFDRLDKSDGLLGHGYTRFDLRQPGQMTVRVATPGPPAGKAAAVAI